MIGKATAIKRFMGTEKPVQFAELKELLQADKEGYYWMAGECARALGEELEPEPKAK